MIDQGQPIDVPRDWAVRKLLRRRWWQRTGDEKQIAALLQAGSSANLVEIRGNNVRFYHQLIQEYFAAVALNDLSLWGRVAHPRFEWSGRSASKWNQVIIALCGSAPHKADTLVQEVSEQDPYLAAMCIASGANVSEATQQSVIASLRPNLRNQARARHEATAQALAQIGVAAVPSLLEALRDPDSRVRFAITSALRQIGHPATMPGLLEALRDPDSRVRGVAAEALEQIGAAAVPGLLVALRDRAWDVRQAAARTLGQIGDAAAVPGLREALHDQNLDVRSEAVRALGQIGTAAAVPSLIEQLSDMTKPYFSAYRICDLAAEALERIATPEALAAVAEWRCREQGNG